MLNSAELEDLGRELAERLEHVYFWQPEHRHFRTFAGRDEVLSCRLVVEESIFGGSNYDREYWAHTTYRLEIFNHFVGWVDYTTSPRWYEHSASPTDTIRMENYNPLIVIRGQFDQSSRATIEYVYRELLEVFHQEAIEHIDRQIEAGSPYWGEKRLDPRLGHVFRENDPTRSHYFGNNRPLYADCNLHKVKTQADKKAEKLFLSILTDEQKKEWAERAEVTVEGQLTGDLYTLFEQRTINIVCLDKTTNSQKCKYCIVPVENVPMLDQLTGQILLITANEKYFLETAIKW